MSIPGMLTPGSVGGRDAYAGLTDEQKYQLMIQKNVAKVIESCPGKAILSGGAGFALGGAFGLFMSSMRYDTPLSSPLAQSNPTNPLTNPSVANMSLRRQLVLGLKDMGKTSYSQAKTFGVIGGIYSFTECGIEGLRAKKDLYNSGAAGCITGGAIAAKAGPQAVAVGCAGFAAFSLAIDWYMALPEEERRNNVI